MVCWESVHLACGRPWVHPRTGKEKGGWADTTKINSKPNSSKSQERKQAGNVPAYSKAEMQLKQHSEINKAKRCWEYGSGKSLRLPWVIQASFSKKEKKEEKKTTYTKSTHEPLLRWL